MRKGNLLAMSMLFIILLNTQLTFSSKDNFTYANHTNSISFQGKNNSSNISQLIDKKNDEFEQSIKKTDKNVNRTIHFGAISKDGKTKFSLSKRLDDILKGIKPVLGHLKDFARLK